jgi:hypothetical protein
MLPESIETGPAVDVAVFAAENVNVFVVGVVRTV